MTTLRGTVPVSVPMTRGTPGFTGEVTAPPWVRILRRSTSCRMRERIRRPRRLQRNQRDVKPEDPKPADANAPAKPADATPALRISSGTQTPDPKAKKKKKDKKVKPQPATNPPASTTPATQKPPGHP